MIFVSWYILRVKGGLFLKKYEPVNALLLEALSIFFCVIGYLFLLCNMLLPANNYSGDSIDSTNHSYLPPNIFSRAFSRTKTFTRVLTSFECVEKSVDYFLLCQLCPRNRTKSAVIQVLCCIGVVTLGIHFSVHFFIPVSHRQSQEIVLMLCRVFVDSIMLVGGFGCAMRDVTNRALMLVEKTLGVQWKNTVIRGLNILKYMCYGVLLYFLLQCFGAVMGTLTIPQLQLSILGEPMNPCAGEGLQIKSALAASWAFPAMHPRRLFNFYIGSEKCSRPNWHSIGFVDRENEVLVLSSKCPGRLGERPRVFIERPEKSEFTGGDVQFPETVHGNEMYHAQIEALYGTESKASSEGVVVHRWPKDQPGNGGRIRAVEWDPSKLPESHREPLSKEESHVREQWPGRGVQESVLEVPLGRSAAYSVYCEETDTEEYFVQPMHRPGPWGKARSEGCHVADEVPGSVLVILFDALSRQNVVRRLPRFTEWVRGFQARQAKRKEGYIIRELHHTTLGISTSGNFAPYFSGTSKTPDSQAGLKEEDLNYMDRSLFNLVKATYGDAVSTSMTTGYCSDMAEYLLFGQEKTGGRGDRYQGIDYYTFQPFCHAEYGAQFGNFQGPYSIVPRCIDNRNVHQHFFDYLHTLLYRQLKDHRVATEEKGCSHYFFNVAHFIESHEGTHGSIGVVDEDLTAFMRILEEDLHFFDDSRNTLLFLSDHGSHMGPYYEIFDAGKFERTTPAMLYFVHPETMRRVDARKQRAEGLSLQNFMKRSRRISTPLDLYLTLGDILGLTDLTVSPFYQQAVVPAASLFDKRHGKGTLPNEGDAPVHSCHALFHGGEPFPCLLDLCEPVSSS